MTDHKRKLKNIIVNKPFQMRMTYYFAALCIGLMGFMMVILNSHLNGIRNLIANIPSLPMTAQIEMEKAISQMITTSFGFLVLASVCSIIYGVFISHRIAGPMYAITRYIESLKAGQYDDTRPLRPYDELKPIMDSLQELAASLKKK